MRIGLCGNIDLSVMAEWIDKTMPGNEIITGLPNTFTEELQNPPENFRNLDYCIIALNWKLLVPDLFTYGYGDSFEDINLSLICRMNQIADIINKYRIVVKIPILVFSPITVPVSSLGFIERLQSNSRIDAFVNFQYLFNAMCKKLSDVYPVDLNALCDLIGRNNAFDNKSDYNCHQPFSNLLIDTISNHIRAMLTQLIRYPLKCLILDLDNTIWGGIVGESGLNGIVLSDAGPGRAYFDFQCEIVKLYKQGVLIAVCSKNNTCDALEVLECHPEMLLRPEMISCFRINWDDKPKNILEIAEELNIGLDSMLFVDDNPFERDLVKKLLPEVEILDLPPDPVNYADCLARCTRFWPVLLTSEDQKKSRFSRQNIIRMREAELTGSKEEFLMNSKIIAKVGYATGALLPRIVQLFNKTNQFNLTTRRFSHSELQALYQKNGNTLFFMDLTDKFGEYGLIACALIKNTTIDSFAVSCRVYGKDAEYAFLAVILNTLKTCGLEKIKGVYIPSGKNSLARDFYKQAGFTCTSCESKETVWEIDVSKSTITIPPWINIIQLDMP
jgi:FkbH-like protein